MWLSAELIELGFSVSFLTRQHGSMSFIVGLADAPGPCCLFHFVHAETQCWHGEAMHQSVFTKCSGAMQRVHGCHVAQVKHVG